MFFGLSKLILAGLFNAKAKTDGFYSEVSNLGI